MRLNQLPCGGTRTHDQDENDTRSMAALCQSLLRLRDASKAALILILNTICTLVNLADEKVHKTVKFMLQPIAPG